MSRKQVIARCLYEQGYSVFTQKMVQTGCTESSEDILVHRRLMGIGLTEEDSNGLSCPYIFAVPCSPHLAAELAGERIEPAKIATTTDMLLNCYDNVLLEGAGGLSVPLTLDYTFADYLQEYNYPVILVSSPRLGSINHTLNALEILACRHIRLAAVVYNLHGFNANLKKAEQAMIADSRQVILHYLQKLAMDAEIIDLYSPPQITEEFKAAVERMLLRLATG